ncbi:MAG: hypothetical protein OEY01_04470 [Desulfobulbaceae bacterium]|nr:hypothetical protein [Desulfobulbaceae bacterium]HIJ78435.1 hypothetical protein [Deltaproteobacteria bacterium]
MLTKPTIHPIAGHGLNDYQPATGTMIRKILIGRTAIGIAEEAIALIKPVADKQRRKYIKNSQVPLKDFGGLFRGLAKQFQGELSKLKNSRLRKLALPVMIPRGFGLPTTPDESGTLLLTISNGPRHGIIICSEIGEQAAPLSSFTKTKNGDIAGMAEISDNEELPVLNYASILEREGFLSIPA